MDFLELKRKIPRKPLFSAVPTLRLLELIESREDKKLKLKCITNTVW